MHKGKTGQIVLTVLLLLLLCALYALRAMLPDPAAEPELPTVTEAPVQEAAPVPAATPEPTPAPTPAPTAEPTPDPTPEPVQSYTFHFAGDCTIGSLVEWQGSNSRDFQSVVGVNYGQPLANVQGYFANDDFTMVNLEGTFTTGTAAVEKKYRFKADPAYAAVLSEGSVEAVSVANNHAGDLGDSGRADTRSALSALGIQYADAGEVLIRELERGGRIGVVTYNTVENLSGEAAWRQSVQNDIERCKAEGCDFIIGFMHWGTVEYLTAPEAWEVQLARDMVDWGCGLIVGGHAHILQRAEVYNGVPIFYSMGNFCYGGHLNPDDKDSMIVEARLNYDPAEGTLTLASAQPIPCLVSSRKDTNDYCPTPCDVGGEDYIRILNRLEWTGDSTPRKDIKE